MNRSHTKSSFNGFILEMQDIAVDNFQDTLCKAYFLSHCHTDHTSGLFSEALLEHLKNNDDIFVYMSVPSAAIIKHESGNSEIMKFVRTLDIGTTTLKIPHNLVTETEDLYITVTVIPAAHCFGSVMFLFRTPYYTILYTGDFRTSENSVPKYAQLHENGKVVELDALYVDTTFLTEFHEDFPKRSDSVAAALQHIKPWLHSSTNGVALHTSAKYGYEFVYNQIFKLLGEKVYVGDDLWKLYSQFPNQIPGVTNDVNSRIHLCRNRTETKSHEDCLRNHSVISAFLYVHFSALKWTGYQHEDIEIKYEPKKRRIDVCFATHCSKNELLYFINYLSPRRIVGFPNEYIEKEKNVENVCVIKSVKEEIEEEPKMLGPELFRQIFWDDDDNSEDD